MANYEPLIVKDDRILLLNQKKLPHIVEYFEAKTVEDVCFAIKDMVVRGAPLIGIAAAFGVYLSILNTRSIDNLKKQLEYALLCLSKTRPTAVNLFFALDEMKKVFSFNSSLSDNISEMRDKAFEIWDNQKKSDLMIGVNGAEFLKGRGRILTHCNTGSLATGGIGTALGIIKTMNKKGYLESVFVDETRPYLQGSRLTAFELQNEGIDYRIVTDNSCGILMKKGLIDAVIVGADRIAKNGDTANKVGTYCLAVMAKRHNIPFIVAAPESTIDKNISSGKDIVVEERDETEVLKFGNSFTAPHGSKALNYSFDLTDNSLIVAIVTQKQVYERFEF